MAHALSSLAEHLRVRTAALNSSSDLARVLTSLADAGIEIASEVRRAGLVGLLGTAGGTNVQGEEVKKLDVHAHDVLVETLSGISCVAGLASEEEEHVIATPHADSGEFLVLFDPLDGSSNIDANVSVGTIFSILRRTESGALEEREFLQAGVEQVAAGYILYGSSTMFVYTVGSGVDGFTLDPGRGEFFLSHADIRTPQRGKVFSVNVGNYHRFPLAVRTYVDRLTGADGAMPYSLRYVGSLVADFHRNLLYGGVFLYPADDKNERGKLRLLYEGNPLGFLVEQAGGRASTGTSRVLDAEPDALHERTPLFIGSAVDVGEAEQVIAQADGRRRAASAV